MVADSKKRGKDEIEEDDNESEVEEEESEEEEEQEVEEKSVTTRKSLRTRVSSNSPAQSPKKQSPSGRPMRKTKVAATLYMEMLTKDLRNPDEEFDEDYVRNFPEPPSTLKKEKQDLKKNTPRRGRQSKRGSSPIKDEKSKIRKLSKDLEKTEDISPLRKRHQRACTKKTVLRGRKPVLKVKGRLLRKNSSLKGPNLPITRKILRTRNRGKPRKNLSENAESDEDEVIEDEEEDIEEEDKKVEEEINEVDKKAHTSRAGVSETSHPRSRQTRSDSKKVISDTVNKNVSSNQKKRKNVPESSLSEDEDEFEEGKKKTIKSIDQDKRKKRFSDQKKTQKIENDNTRQISNLKRSSLRTIKKEDTENEDEKDSQKTKSPRRSKRNKESDEEQEQTKRGKFTENRRSKYKEESEEESEEDYENSSKTRNSLRQKTNKEDLIVEVQKSTKKNDDSEKIKASKPSNKKIENESENIVRRGRGRIPKNTLSKDSDGEIDLPPRRSKVSNANKSTYESEDDEDEEPLIKKTRGSVKGKQKTEVEDAKKKEFQEDGNSEIKKLKESQHKKSIPVSENDEENLDSVRKVRCQQKKTKNNENDERRSPESHQSNLFKDEIAEDKEKPKVVLKKQKKQTQEKEENLALSTSDVEISDIPKMGKPTSRNKTKKSMEENPEVNLEVKETVSKKNRKNNISKDLDDKNSLKPEIQKKTMKEDEIKVSNDRPEDQESISDMIETKSKSNKKQKKYKNVGDNEQEDFSDNIIKGEEGKKQKNSIAVTISSSKPEKIDNYFSNGPSVADDSMDESKIINKEGHRDSIKGVQKDNKKAFNLVKKDEHTEIKTKVNLEITTEIENPQIQTEVIFKTNVTPSNMDINQEISNIEINIKQEKDAYEIFLENVLNEEELKRKSKLNEIKPENSNFGIVNDPSYSASKKVAEIKDFKVDTNIISNTSYKYVDLNEKGSKKSQKELIEGNESNVSSKELLSRKNRKNTNDYSFRDQINLPSEESVVSHKVKPFSISEKNNEAEETHFLPYSNIDSNESKSFSTGRNPIGDKFSKNVYTCRIEGTHHSENSFATSASDNLNLRKLNEEVGKKNKKIVSDFSSLDEIKKLRTSNEKNSSKDDMKSVVEFNKPRDSKIDENIKETKRHTRLSIGSPERDEKPKRKYESKDKFYEHYIPDSELKPSKPGRKPSLTARAQFITKQNDDDDDDDDDIPPIMSNEKTKPAASIRRKSVGGRDSCDSDGSGSSSVECKVVLSDVSDSLGVRSGDSRKVSKKAKHIERVPERCISNVNTVQFEDTTNKEKSSLINTSSRNFGIGKLEDTLDNAEKPPVTKPSIGDTWRQAFKNAKIPKPGHHSPVQHSVKPFIRQKLPNLSSSFQGKSEQRPSNSSKGKSSPNLSPFKSMIAQQSQRSMSPDAKKHLSPAHKVSFSGYESPGKRNEDVKCDFKKQEPPAKTLTQLQYEKRSSEFINSYLDPGPTKSLPGFESIRAYKKEMKKDEPKEVVKAEPASVPPPISEPVVKPSPEGKHLNLPLAVEHTLRKNSPITVSKKPPMKPVFPQEKRIENIPVTKPILPSVVTIEEKGTQGPPVVPPASASLSTSCQTLPPVRDLLVRDQADLSAFPKKKVNMTTEEINRWLNDSTSTGIEHKKDCGIFENNKCECSYRTSEASMQNSVGVSELVPKEEKIDHGVVEPPVQLKELDKTGKYVAETISTCKVEDYKEKLLSKTSPPDTKMAPPRARRSSGHDKHKSNKSMTEDEMCEYDFRFDRISNSPRESMSDVSSVTQRDDASSSSEIPDRKIFHQKRTSNSKRPSISSPTAFSAENESSIYAFDPDPDPPASAKKPFRRGRGKSGEQEDKNASSSSIAVQVNLHENEGGLECSTQTERSSDDDDIQLFYIPLPDEQLHTGLPQGVAVKVDTEGPEQRVIMRAKLVTKPNKFETFPSAASVSNCRGFHHPRRDNHPRPAQKVRPLWPNSGRAPVGKVHPTMREPDKSDQGTTTKEKCRPSGQVSQSTQISQTSPGSPRASRNSNKSQKHTESKPLVETAPFPTAIEWRGTEFPSQDTPPTFVEAPTFYPTEKEFQDPLEYIEQLTPLAQSFGICRIVPPASFKPECKVSDDMRFTAYNQYVHKLMERWGPNVKELCAIKKYLTTQSISLTQLPLIGSMEVDLPRLYQTVQQQGGLKEVIEKKRWARVADAMRIPKSAQDRLTKLDDIYCKYLLPYDTLSHVERSKLLEEVEEDWQEREKRRAAEEEVGNSAEGSDDTSDADDNLFECISKGKNMPLSAFYRVARNTMYMWFKENTPSPGEVEAEFWQHVSTRNYHVCVHCGSIDSGTWGYGFPTTKTSATSRHPWNLKVLTNSPGSILRSLGPVMGVTVPTLHVGMLFSSCCWYRDPHGLPWIEYLHTGASKIWYGVPGSRATELRNAMYPLLPRHTRDKAIWLPSDTMMVPPQYLLEGGVSVCRVVQEPGQFVLVFPKAFTSTISTGYIVSESVYFAQPSWLNTALQVFKDIQDSCEPPVFSLHKLLFSIANDTRSSADILIQILPMLTLVIECEVGSRKKLETLGLTSTSWERLPSGKAGRRKKQEEEPNDLECDTCRGALFLSMVTNSNEDCSYCIDHAIEAISKDQGLLKYCKLLFAYDEEEMEELVAKVKVRIESKSQKKQKEKATSNCGAKN